MSAGLTMWADAATAAVVFAVDPAGTGGIRLRSGAGPVRDSWLSALRECLPPSVPVRKLPPSVSDDRLLGGLDLAATLQSGRPVVERGLLAEVDGGILLAVMAERLPSSTVAHLNAVMDCHELVVERDGVSRRTPLCFGVIALDEGPADEAAPAALCDRLACHIDLQPLSTADVGAFGFDAADVAEARTRLPQVVMADEVAEALCHAAVALGIASLRAPLLAVRVARVLAALDRSDTVLPAHAEGAARLVLAPRATVLPAPAEQPPEPPPDQERTDPEERREDEMPLDDLVLDAAQAAIPPDLLKLLRAKAEIHRSTSKTSGKEGVARMSAQRGRPIGVRRGQLGGGVRLNVLETLRAAAPWQPLRRRSHASWRADDRRLLIHKDDIRITKFKQRSATSTIFVVDASGSSALQRLAEVKGAVELLLADCYVRRDEVALIAFRGRSADLLLPPTRSLARAKRSLAALPGGGGTPLSAAILAATTLALAVRSKGHSPTIVLMTDGRANVCRDGNPGRAAAEAEAHDAARQLRAAAIPAVLIDTSPRPQAQAQSIASEMHARYVALPFADASRLSRAVQSNMPGRS